MKKPLTLRKIFYKYVIPACGIVLISALTLAAVIALFGTLFLKSKGH